MTSLRRFLLPLLAAAALAACSLPRLAYESAPPVLAWMVDDYFDLSGHQRRWVHERLERTLAWHRATELPEYGRFLESAIARTADGITTEDSRWAYASMRSAWRRAAEHMLPEMAEFLARIEPAQVAALERKFREGNAKIDKDRRKGSDARRAERYVDRFEDWTGRLSKAQRELVAARTATLEDLVEEWVADRRRRQDVLLEALRSGAQREATLARLRLLLIDTDQGRDPLYIRKLREREEKVHELVAALDATLTPHQREHVQQRMQGYYADVVALAAKR